MNKTHILLFALLISGSAFAQNEGQSEYAAINLLVGYDSNRGLQHGASAALYLQSNGRLSPEYGAGIAAEAFHFSNGAILTSLSYDERRLAPGLRWKSSIVASQERELDFYGFNGYRSYFNHKRVAIGNANDTGGKNPLDFLYTPFYRISRTAIRASSSLSGSIAGNFKWEAYYQYAYYDQGPIDIDRHNATQASYNVYIPSYSTLFDNYLKWGLISSEEAGGGVLSSLSAAFSYDSRDSEHTPVRGLLAKAQILIAPKWLGSSIPCYSYGITLRQYLPVTERLRLAYRLGYDGVFGSNAPYYALPYLGSLGESYDELGGYSGVRGILRNRVVGLDVASANAQLRVHTADFTLMRQSFTLHLSLLGDAALVVRGRDMASAISEQKDSYEDYISQGAAGDSPHISIGAGVSLTMNKSFFIRIEGAIPTSNMLPNSHPLYGQDGPCVLYINMGNCF